MKSFKLFFEEISEALTAVQRKKRSKIMQQKSAQIARKRERTMNKMAPLPKLKKRALKKARDILSKKILKDRDKNDLPLAGKEALEKKLDKKKAVIKRIAKKLLPTIKAKETERINQRRSSE